MRIIGKQVQDQAKQLGLTNQPQYTFYGRPRKIKAKFSKIKPDFAYIVEDWMMSVDPSTTTSESGKARSSSYYYLAPQLNLYVEIVDKLSGYFAYSEENHACKIDIYANNEDHVRIIIKSFNAQWDDGIVPHLNLKKLEKKYKVKGEDIVNAWNSFL